MECQTFTNSSLTMSPSFIGDIASDKAYHKIETCQPQRLAKSKPHQHHQCHFKSMRSVIHHSSIMEISLQEVPALGMDGLNLFPTIPDAPENVAHQSTNLAEWPMPTSAAQKVLSNISYVLVPYCWSRVVSNSGNSVYYITPSGRVLLTPDEVTIYINQERHCRCYLSPNLSFAEVFNWDPAVGSLQLNEDSVEKMQEHAYKWRCVSWINLISESDRTARIRATRNYIFSQEVSSLENAKLARDAIGLDSAVAFDDWLASADWKDFIVTQSGEIFSRQITNDHLRHLAFELAQSGIDLSSYVHQLFMASAVLEEGEQQEDNTKVAPCNSATSAQQPHDQLVFMVQSANGSSFDTLQLDSNGNVSQIIDDQLILYLVDGYQLGETHGSGIVSAIDGDTNSVCFAIHNDDGTGATENSAAPNVTPNKEEGSNTDSEATEIEENSDTDIDDQYQISIKEEKKEKKSTNKPVASRVLPKRRSAQIAKSKIAAQVASIKDLFLL